jgi:biopolymer transport protein ExbB
MVATFIRGGIFMWPILLLMIWGFMISFERFYTLTKSSLVTKKFIPKLTNALRDEGVDAALKVCRETSGPIAEIFAAGLDKASQGMVEVEKSMQATGAVELSFLEKGMIWLSTVISLAPMFGFAGTVSGMIGAFDAIAKANDISPAIVANGIAEALLTTIFGLGVAMPMQIFYNIFMARIDAISVEMEENSITFIETMKAKIEPTSQQ